MHDGGMNPQSQDLAMQAKSFAVVHTNVPTNTFVELIRLRTFGVIRPATRLALPRK